jgi:hypothetical protein
MNKTDLENLISKSIHEISVEYLRELRAHKQAQATADDLNGKSVTEDEFDSVMFYGGKQPQDDHKKTGKITIKEGSDSNLRITVSEIKDFENSFNDILENIPGASIVLDKQKNGYSIVATKRADGIEAKASGIINLGDNGKIVWSYSILNGFNLNAQNLKLTQGNKTMFEALSNHYDDWQKKWREKLNLPTAAQEPDQAAAPADMGTGANAAANMAPSPGGQPEGGAPATGGNAATAGIPTA